MMTAIGPYILGGAGVYLIKAVGDDVPDGVDGVTRVGIDAGSGSTTGQARTWESFWNDGST